MFLQRSLQKGLNGLLAAYMLSPPQLGHTTIFTRGLSFFIAGAAMTNFSIASPAQEQSVNSNIESSVLA